MKQLIIIFFCLCYGASSQLQINEVCSDNDELLESDDGEYYDWIEIYNSSDNSVQLGDYYLSDDYEKLEQWNFNNELLPPKSYIIVFASDLAILDGNEQHANFKLSSKGETLYLSNGEELIDTMEFGALNEDYTYGRLEENSDITTYFAKPTPYESNSKSGTIIANRESGYYDDEFDLILAAAEGQKIYYTTNGDDPTEESNLYEGKIEIKDEYEDYEYLDIPTSPPDSFGCKIKWFIPKVEIPRCNVVSYRTISQDGEKGRVYSKSFFQEQNHELPVVSIIVDNQSLFNQDTGIYVPGTGFNELNPCWTGNYFYRSWERAASVSYFKENIRILEENVGIKIHGGGTRNTPQKSFRLYARKKYGINKLPNTLLPELEIKEFNNILLRSSVGGWFETKIKDAVTMEVVRNLNIEPSYVQPVVVYINGNYWGISEWRNRIDNDFLAEKYEINKESINLIHPSTVELLKSGTYEDFRPIYDFITQEDLSISQNYNFIETKLDIPNIIDYYIAETYFNNFDWPHNNILFWNSNELDGKYRTVFYDLDGGWGDANYDMIAHATQDSLSDWPNPKEANLVLIKLLENQEFKNKFVNRALDLIENEFHYDKLLPVIEKYISFYEPEIENSINRFGFLESKQQWIDGVNSVLVKFAQERGCIYKEHLVNHFDLDSNLLCSITSVEDIYSEYSISPNPATNFITIDNIDSDYISIIDIHGTELMKISSKFKKSLRIDISKLVPSVYFLKSNNSVYKFIKID